MEQNKSNQCTSKGNIASRGVQTHESLNVNTLLEASMNIKAVDLSRQSFLKCFYTNATSLNNKFDELIEEINNKEAQLIMVCETWWTEESATNIDGFSLFRKDREYSRGGGVGIYVANSIKSYQVTEECFLDNKIEQVWCSIEIGLDNILCGCIYRTGVSDISNCEKITKSIRYAYDAWQKGKYSGILICGDFNFSNIKWLKDGSCIMVKESDLIASNFIECMNDCFIYQNVLLPTFQVSYGSESNLLDLVLSESNNRIDNLKHLPPLGGIEHGHHVLNFNYNFKNEKIDSETEGKHKILFKSGNIRNFLLIFQVLIGKRSFRI